MLMKMSGRCCYKFCLFLRFHLFFFFDFFCYFSCFFRNSLCYIKNELIEVNFFFVGQLAMYKSDGDITYEEKKKYILLMYTEIALILRGYVVYSLFRFFIIYFFLGDFPPMYIHFNYPKCNWRPYIWLSFWRTCK